PVPPDRAGAWIGPDQLAAARQPAHAGQPDAGRPGAGEPGTRHAAGGDPVGCGPAGRGFAADPAVDDVTRGPGGGSAALAVTQRLPRADPRYGIAGARRTCRPVMV